MLQHPNYVICDLKHGWLKLVHNILQSLGNLLHPNVIYICPKIATL